MAEAATLLGLSERQRQRLKARYEPDQVEWVRHGIRSKAKPWRLAASVRRRILALAKGNSAGFSDSHLTEKLNRVERIRVSSETVRHLLRAAHMASPQKRRRPKYRSRRDRRPRRGMMVLAGAKPARLAGGPQADADPGGIPG